MADPVVTPTEDNSYDHDYDELLAALTNPSKVLITEENALEGDDGKPDPDEDTFNVEDNATPEAKPAEAAKPGPSQKPEASETPAEAKPSGETPPAEAAKPVKQEGTPAAGDSELLSLVKQQGAVIEGLQRQLRDMKLETAKTVSRSHRPAAAPKEAPKPAEESEDPLDSLFKKETPTETPKEAPAELSRVDRLEAEISKIADTNAGILDIQLDTLAGTKEFSDVKEVCSQDNFRDMVAAIADALTSRQGGNYAERYLEVELSIWSRPNPFKYMYELIKTHHPKYAKATPGGKETPPKDGETPKPEQRKPEATDAPGSIQDVGTGAATTHSGWTAAKIDALPEDELHTVPEDVYELYMQGKLK